MSLDRNEETGFLSNVQMVYFGLEKESIRENTTFHSEILHKSLTIDCQNGQLSFSRTSTQGQREKHELLHQ